MKFAWLCTALLAAPPMIFAAHAAQQPDAVPFFMSGAGLMEPCALAAKDNAAQAACVLYIVGVADALNQYPATRTCIDLKASKTDLANVVVAWLGKHPEQRDSPAASSINLAMKEAYPCGK